MSFDWNLSSDEESGVNGNWDDVDLYKSIASGDNGHAGSAKKLGANFASIADMNGQNNRATSYDDDDDNSGASSSSDEDRNDYVGHSNDFSGVPLFSASNEYDSIKDGDDEDSVDWEDAGDGLNETPELHTDMTTVAALSTNHLNLKPVTVDWTKKTDSPVNKKKRKKEAKRVARKRYRFEQLAPHMQQLLVPLEKSHLLSLTSHAIYASQQASSDLTLHLAHSLIPLAWHNSNQHSHAPTINELASFCNFYFHLIHPNLHQTAADVVMNRTPRRPTTNRRRRQQNMPKGEMESGGILPGGKTDTTIRYRTEEYCAHLDATLAVGRTNCSAKRFHRHEQVRLFIAMVRSLGWRARFVMAMEPIKKDLDPNHPIFVAMAAQTFFRKLWKCTTSTAKQSTKIDGSTTAAENTVADDDGGGKMPAKRGVKTEPDATKSSVASSSYPSSYNATRSPQPLCWVEVLCKTNGSEKTRTRRVHKNGQDGHSHSQQYHWVHVDPSLELFNRPDSVEVALYATSEGIAYSKAKRKLPIPYALAAEHVSISDTDAQLRLVDVTPRYASSYVETLKCRGVLRSKQKSVPDKDRVDKWWVATLKLINGANGNNEKQNLQTKGHTEADAIELDNDCDTDKKHAANPDKHLEETDTLEQQMLHETLQNEPIPTSKASFKTSPVYVLPSLFNVNEVLKPNAKKRICGMFKGEFVFRRSDVETALSARRWLYKGRMVNESELSNPIKRVKKRAKPSSSSSFKALKSYGVGQSNDGSEATRSKILDAASQPLDDGMEDLYGSWQTRAWKPDYIGPNDEIPFNEHKNIELALLNPGLVHIDKRNVAKVAKKLGIPYAPCLLGFEGHGGNRTPTIRGIVVHEHNEELLREAHVEMESHLVQEEHERQQQAVLLRWKRLLVGVLTRDRLDRAYGEE